MSKHFSVDARAMLTWGRESIKDHTTAVLELVKNSYDANASVVEVEIKAGLYADAGAGPFIRVADNGVGMTGKDVTEHWLRLGYSAKREHRFTARGRRKTGEKGVGRISADRLGAILELRSQASSTDPVGLRVCWNDFEEPGRDIQTVPVDDISQPRFLVPKPSLWDEQARRYGAAPQPGANSGRRTGTELMIRDLRQIWMPADVEELHRVLALLLPPFDHVEDFQIRLDTDIEPSLNGVVQSPMLASAAIEASVSLDHLGRVSGHIIHRNPHSRRKVRTTISESIEQMVHPKARRDDDKPPNIPATLGPVAVKLLFYPQKAETVRGLDLGLGDLREFLRLNAGVKVYRDSVRVPPYGDQGKPEGDWLGLGDRKARNPAGPHRPDFRVSPYQLVGAVFLGRDANPGLIDTSGREGLVNGPALGLLKSFLLSCLRLLERHYHTLFTEQRAEPPEPQESPRDTVEQLRKEFSELSSRIEAAQSSIPPASRREFASVLQQLGSTFGLLKQAERTFEELGTQAATSRTLATIGIAAATFGHETQRGLDSMKAALHAAQLFIRNGEDTNTVLDELESAISEADRVSAWGAFALGRVRRDKRQLRTINVAEHLEEVLDQIRPAIEASSITITQRLDGVRARVFPMDVECVLINLVTNAYYFSKQSRRERQIAVRLKEKSDASRAGFQIVVSDSGPGVAESLTDRVWEALYTTKTDESGTAIGTGLGLALVNAVVQDVEGNKQIDKDPRLGGARFAIWLPSGV